MRIKTLMLFAVISIILLVGCKHDRMNAPVQLSQELEKGFVTPPSSIQTSVYWYWISDNISKEGAVRDLHAMKKAGINRAFIGNIGIEDLPYGKVKMFSDEWWEIMHTALKTATELDIEIGIFNSPGWSQSGGPWIEPEQSMRYLASSETKVKGSRTVTLTLPKPNEDFQDVKVIAIPDVTREELTLTHKNAVIESEPQLPNLARLTDNDPETGVNLPGGNSVTISFKSKEPFTARSLTLQSTRSPLMAEAVLEAREGEKFNTVSKFVINRSNPALNVGFDPYAPVTIAIPATTSSEFRLQLNYHSSGSGVAEISLSGIPRMERYSEKTLAKMHPTPLPYWHDYLWPDQPEVDDNSLIIQESQIIDLTDKMSSDGVLNWDVPEGAWTILRMGMAPTGVTNGPASPEATGLEVDKMSKKWTALHFDRFIGEILRRIPEEERKTFKVVVQDSYETGGQNFTDGMIEEFKERYGYDPSPYLPVFNGYVVNSRMESDRFLWDLRRMIADKVAYDYVGGLREVSHQHGLTTWLENYGHWGFPSEFLMYGGQSDEIGGEFWSQGDLGDIENRAATSAGHIYGKTRISAESNTSGGPAYSRHPAMMKQRTDRFFAEGINNTLLHVYIMQPYEDKNPGVNAWFGNEFDRKNTWFTQIDLFTQYLKRVNFMLQQGLNVADVAYFIGEDAPKMTGVVDPALPLGYQFDYINAEVILRDMTVKDGMLTLPHGTQYRVLVLPKLETMRPELLAKIKDLVAAGACILGPAPKRSPSLQNQPEADNQVKQMASELWGDIDGETVKERKFGKGVVMSGLTMEEVFEKIALLPDCKLPEDNSIHYGHRTMAGIEIYFLSNQTDKERIIQPQFRVTGKQPEVWDATSGTIRSLPAFEISGEQTTVPLKLAPYESLFVVFRNKAGKSAGNDIALNYPSPDTVKVLQGPWMVTFDPAFRGPAAPVLFETLVDWTTSSNDSIRYYSGTARYNITFTLTEENGDRSIMLDLGNLTAMAKVKVNGNYAGGVWTHPYRLDITQWVKPGQNDLEIEVVNNWMNRLIGDLNLPEDQRETWCYVNPYNAKSPLQPSGLFGPVTIQSLQYQGN
ncbi:glycosyl hydrolase [Petrimonas mucosa]|uniref:glycosyl hydrolase n=1 Tax=Petrimonas mucosa TaxID=1642646 RepID=UPI0008E767DB|nr:alpha-L-rhamnosidase [Porphyromonadaceae bacterium KHP3R9]